MPVGFFNAKFRNLTKRNSHGYETVSEWYDCHMARPSKLTDAQWDKIGQRLLKGEKAADLAREYGVSKTRISVRFSDRIETVKEVAKQIVVTERRVAALPMADQIAARTLADELKAISLHMASAAKYGAATAHRLKAISNSQVDKIDDADPLNADGIETLKKIAALERTANEAAELPMGLLKANQATIDAMNRPEQEDVPAGLGHFYGED